MSTLKLIFDIFLDILILNSVWFTTKLTFSETDFCIEVDVLNRIKFY